jgi:hypothetical protein
VITLNILTRMAIKETGDVLTFEITLMDPGHLEKSMPPGVSEVLAKGVYWGKQTLNKNGPQ